MSLDTIKNALSAGLGYVPVIASYAERDGFLIGSAAVPPDVDPGLPEEAGAPVDFVIDPARRAMVIRVDGHEPCFVHPIDGPSSLVFRMVCSISDEDEWRAIRDGGDAAAMVVLFNGQPDAKGHLTFGEIGIEHMDDLALIEVAATSSDRAATIRLAREMRREPGWVPENLHDAVFEIGVASSDAPCPIEMGYEIDLTGKWGPLLDRFPQARAAVQLARERGGAAKLLLREIVEEDIAMAQIRWEGAFMEMVSVEADGTFHRLSPNSLTGHLPPLSPVMEL